jgi:hypothetical protein
VSAEQDARLRAALPAVLAESAWHSSGSWIRGLVYPAGANELRERLPGWVSPTDAKRMPGRVRVHLVALGGIEIRSWLEQSGTKGDCLFVRGSRVVDVEVEMHLLGSPIRPVRRNMVRRQLHANPPLSSSVDDAVPIVFLEDVPTENTCPERTLRM